MSHESDGRESGPGHRFEVGQEFEVPASPEQVWDAIATGAGVDSWFIGHSRLAGGAGGAVRTEFGGHELPGSTISGWQPGRRLAYGSEPGPDGRFVAYEFLIEGRDGATTVLRTVTSGFLPGDDWAGEYEAMTLGWQLYARTLVEYLGHFAGRAATVLTAFGPPVADWERAWAAVWRAFDLAAPARPGDRVRFTVEGYGVVDGVVYFVNPHTVGIRAGDALYRVLRGFHGAMIAGHHVFRSDLDTVAAEDAWRHWLTGRRHE